MRGPFSALLQKQPAACIIPSSNQSFLLVCSSSSSFPENSCKKIRTISFQYDWKTVDSSTWRRCCKKNTGLGVLRLAWERIVAIKWIISIERIVAATEWRIGTLAGWRIAVGLLVFIYSNQIECHVNYSNDVFTLSTVIVYASRCRRSERGGVLRRSLRHGFDEWICTEMDKKKQSKLR